MSSITNIPFGRQLLLVALLFQAAVSSAQNDPEDIASHFAPLERRAAHFVAAALSIAAVGQYHARFRYSDQLDDDSWSFIAKQFVMLSELAHKRAALSLRGTTKALEGALVSELSKIDPPQLAEISTFLESPSGKEWLRGNTQYEDGFLRAFVIAALTNVSPQRRRALEKKAGSEHADLVRSPPLLLLHAIVNSPANVPSMYSVFLTTKLSGVVEPSLDAPAAGARKALAAGAKNGLSNAAYKALMQSFASAMRATNTRMDMFRFQDKEFESLVSDRVKDLAERAFLAADQMNTTRCRLALPAEVLQDIGTDVSKVMSGSTPVRPGSVEHSWIAMSFERGCHVKKDFSIALRVWEDMAAAGNVLSYCKIANYYRLGVGTRPNPELGREWAEKYKAIGQGRVCEVMAIHPERPWAGLSE